jgi:hypothetical protein
LISQLVSLEELIGKNAEMAEAALIAECRARGLKEDLVFGWCRSAGY